MLEVANSVERFVWIVFQIHSMWNTSTMKDMLELGRLNSREIILVLWGHVSLNIWVVKLCSQSLKPIFEEFHVQVRG
jgi:hypothetical protein